MAFGSSKKFDTEDELYGYAVGALARQMRTVAELKRLMRRRVDTDTEYGRTLIELVIQKPKDQHQATRSFRQLSRAGFTSKTIFKILKRWDVDDETLSALEGEAAEPQAREEE